MIKQMLAEDLDVPVVISYQFNRQAVKDKKKGASEAGLEDIAYTDAIGQLSSIVLGLLQPESIETIKQREIQVLKGRNGEHGKFKINWNFDHGPDYMNFTQYIEPEVKDLNFIG